MIIYVFAILAQGTFGNSKELDAAGFNSYDFFGTVPRSMASLFQMMCFDSWSSQIMRPVGNVYTFAFFFFCFFVSLASMGMLNLLTAIFVDSLSTLSTEDAIQNEQMEAEAKHKMVTFIEETFQTFDRSGSGTLTREEVVKALQALGSAEYQHLLKDAGIELETIKGAINLADLDGDGEVAYHELMHGLEQMEDKPTKRNTWEIISMVLKVDRDIHQKLARIESKLDLLHRSSANRACKAPPDDHLDKTPLDESRLSK